MPEAASPAAGTALSQPSEDKRRTQRRALRHIANHFAAMGLDPPLWADARDRRLRFTDPSISSVPILATARDDEEESVRKV